jgi:hypothetical protein
VQEAPAYGRIDLIAGPRGDPVLLEAEMIDPYLSFDLAPRGGGEFGRCGPRSLRRPAGRVALDSKRMLPTH